MRNSKNNLKRAEHKVTIFRGKEWVGCMTPSQALALIEDGAKSRDESLYSKEKLIEMKSKGYCPLIWFYFYPTEKQIKRWNNV